jgi:hypothetical protein
MGLCNPARSADGCGFHFEIYQVSCWVTFFHNLLDCSLLARTTSSAASERIFSQTGRIV